MVLVSFFRLAGLACLLLSSPCLAQEALVPPASLGELGRVALKLARSGMTERVGELLEILAGLGLPRDQVVKLEVKARQLLKKCKKPKEVSPDTAKTLARIATRLARQLEKLEKLEAPRAQELARLILRIDAQQELAHTVLSHQKVQKRWLSTEQQRLEERRQEIQGVLRRARHMAMETTIGPSDDPLLAAVSSHERCLVHWRDVSFHSSFGRHKTERILRESIRALAVSEWLRTGKFDAPKWIEQKKWILVSSRAEYLRAVDYAAKEGYLDGKKRSDLEEQASFSGYRGYVVASEQTEATFEAGILHHLMEPLSLPCMRMGHLNWVCLSYLGTKAPLIFWTEVEEAAGGRSGRTVAKGSREEAQRQEYRRLSEAGLAGSRSWLRYLVGRKEDPPLSKAMFEHLGQLQGDELCKATFVVECLQEKGPLERLFKRTEISDLELSSQIKFFEKSVAQTLPDFEQRWRAWLMGDQPSLCEQLRKPHRPAPSKEEKQVLDFLNELRLQALAGVLEKITAVTLDESLSAGARMHADYLHQNPKQARAWPDAHEEYPDAGGFSTMGSRAGLNSVIASGLRKPKESIEQWMGTFYHRLPLLETGLVRIGWGFQGGIAVLDAGSLCKPRDLESAVVWPANGMRNVPTRFCPELPNPVPGADQSKWGYPVTMQLGERGRRDDKRDKLLVTMTLHRGSASGPVVACHYSTPDSPTNPDLVPRETYCLIPKSHLAKGTRYTVVARFKDDGSLKQWSFMTR